MASANARATGIAFGIAAVACAATAYGAALWVERVSRADVERRMSVAGYDWAEVHTDGLEVVISGTAPDEPARFRAVTLAGEGVDPARIVDALEVTPAQEVAPPRFALEMLRNAAGVSLIGLAPEGGDARVMAALDALEVPYTDLLETAGGRVPEGWRPAVSYALEALEALPQAKISVEPGRVEITAVAESDSDRRRLEARLSSARPDGVALSLQIDAPRPVVAPFTLRATMAEDRLRLSACAVDDEAAMDAVQAAAAAAGFEGPTPCRLALGAPTATWGEAAARAIAALDEVGGGTVTLSDTDVTLVAPEGTDPDRFARIADGLEADLPPLFALSRVLPETVEIDGSGERDDGTPEFVAARGPDGDVRLRGRIGDARQRAAVESYGRALFGAERTWVALREDADLPEGWPVRVLAGLEALDRLTSGRLVVQPAVIALEGQTGDPQAEASIAALLSDRLGAEADYRVDVTYLRELDPTLNIPTPEECEDRLNAVLIDEKVAFDPGAASISNTDPLDALRAVFRVCDFVVVEVEGHTDSQGREVMNEELSQARADAVRAALIERGVPPSQMTAVGYGEARPIADNDTEVGREANRRIEFSLLGRRPGSPVPAGAAAPVEAGAETGAGAADGDVGDAEGESEENEG
ncbi:OmpA family protein [Jannaschia sp. Os4]|uniref:OmpA family protein n=1 Tax=Jannaschia sp. Os4 TaxID=2807617 RepID=UPI001939A9F8|nr:OmpA family protein [Jannaschia sp. Os4]MBM2575008.1 OmpA family protein [Jannaschia sp. Os4]